MSARTHARPLPQNRGAGPPRPVPFGATGFRLSFIFPPPTRPRPGGGFPTLGTGRRRGAEPRRTRSDCLFRSCASAARMGVFSPSTSAAAAPFASAVKVVARTRSARLPLASNGCCRSNSCRCLSSGVVRPTSPILPSPPDTLVVFWEAQPAGEGQPVVVGSRTSTGARVRPPNESLGGRPVPAS